MFPMMADQMNYCRFSSVLSSAFLEWLLMLLLFLDAILSYLLRKVACYGTLQTPCLMCSRLNVLAHGKQGFYRDLICSAHESEISSLAYCRTHLKLANVQEMCGYCLLSLATDKKSNPQTYRSVIGKLQAIPYDVENCNVKHHATVDNDGRQNKYYGDDMACVPLLKEDLGPGSPCTRLCSCCSKSFTGKSHAEMLLRSKITRANIVCQDGLDEKGKKSSRPPAVDRGIDGLSHIGYSELKLTSDSEPDVPFSDDDDGSSLLSRTAGPKEEVALRERLGILSHMLAEPSCSVPEKQLVRESCDTPSSPFIAALGHGLEEIKWSQVKARPKLSLQSESIAEKIPEETALKCPEIGDHGCISTTTSKRELIRTLGYPDKNLAAIRTINDTNRLFVGKPVTPSPTFAEIIKGRESARHHEELKLKLSQISTAQGLDMPWNDMTPSPRAHGQGDESKISDAGSSAGLLPKRRSESCLESLEGSIINEVEGESEVDRLKRQVELGKKSMSILYKELEEERSASAVAANQAMAMINRLQEEKAAMQMEALQYLRMLEEQAEYDQEALQKSNDLLAEREKEIQDLEAEIDCYRKRLGYETLSDDVLDSLCDSDAKIYKSTSSPSGMNSGSGERAEQTLTSPKNIGGLNRIF